MFDTVFMRFLTYISIAPFLWALLANRADPDQMPQNAASDHGRHCLQIKCSVQI